MRWRRFPPMSSAGDAPCPHFVVGKDLVEVGVVEAAADDFSEDVAEVDGYLEIARVLQLVAREAPPLAVDVPAADAAPAEEHRRRATMVGAEAAVLVGAATELRHRDERDAG